MSVNNIDILHESINVSLKSILVQETASNVNLEIVGDIIVRAKEAGVSSYNYTGEQLTSIDYVDFQSVSSNTKTLTYTGDKLTRVEHSWSYDGDSWLLVKEFSYTNDRLTSKTSNLTIS